MERNLSAFNVSQVFEMNSCFYVCKQWPRFQGLWMAFHYCALWTVCCPVYYSSFPLYVRTHLFLRNGLGHLLVPYQEGQKSWTELLALLYECTVLVKQSHNEESGQMVWGQGWNCFMVAQMDSRQSCRMGSAEYLILRIYLHNLQLPESSRTFFGFPFCRWRDCTNC